MKNIIMSSEDLLTEILNVLIDLIVGLKPVLTV